MVREAVSNTVRHAHATALRITVTTGVCGLVIDVTDDGVGIPIRAHRQRTAKSRRPRRRRRRRLRHLLDNHRRVRDTDDTPRSFLPYAAIGTYVSDRRVATLDEPAIRAEVIERVARIRRELGLPVDP